MEVLSCPSVLSANTLCQDHIKVKWDKSHHGNQGSSEKANYILLN